MKKSVCLKLLFVVLILVSSITLPYIIRINAVQGVLIDGDLVFYKGESYQTNYIRGKNYFYVPVSLKESTKGYILTECKTKGIKRTATVYEFNDGDFGSILFSPGFPTDLWFTSKSFSFPDEANGDKVEKVIFVDGANNKFYYSGKNYDVNEKDFVDTLENAENINSFLNYVKENPNVDCSRFSLNVADHQYLEVWIQFENRSLLKKVCWLERQDNGEYIVSLVGETD